MKSVLLLSQTYIPLGIISWKKAVGLVLGRGKADVIIEYEKRYSKHFNAAVVQLTVPSPNPYSIFRKQRFSKKNVFLRDRFKCQYCQKDLNLRDGTIDHVVPRSKGGKTEYLNCVAACKPCNSRKDNKTPEQARMPLAAKIRYPNIHDIFLATEIPAEWGDFLNLIK